MPLKPAVTRLPEPHPSGEYDEVRHWPNGNVGYHRHGHLHRADGPAFVGADGSSAWLLDGKEHRVDGPAVCGADGSVEYWLHGRRVETGGSDASGAGPAWVDRFRRLVGGERGGSGT